MLLSRVKCYDNYNLHQYLFRFLISEINRPHNRSNTEPRTFYICSGKRIDRGPLYGFKSVDTLARLFHIFFKIIVYLFIKF